MLPENTNSNGKEMENNHAWKNRDIFLVSFPGRGICISQRNQQAIHLFHLLKESRKLHSMHTALRNKESC